METNQNLVQENSAQRIALELEQPAEPLYDPAEAARIVHCLTDGYFDPEYILLFGKLVGGTRHSDAMAYDLLMVVRETPEYDWIQTKRILRYKVPYSCRKITYINLYIMTLRCVMSNRTQRRSSSSPMPRASCFIAATATISSVRNTRSTLPRRMRKLNSISKRSACRAMNYLNSRRTLSARAATCVWPRSSRRRQWSISTIRFTMSITVWSSTATIRSSCTTGCGRFPRS